MPPEACLLQPAGNNIPCAASSLESSARSSLSTWCQNQANAVTSIASSMTWRHDRPREASGVTQCRANHRTAPATTRSPEASVEDEVAHLRDLDLKDCTLGGRAFSSGRRLLTRKSGNNAFQ